MNSPRGIAASATPAGHHVPSVVGETEFDATFILNSSGLAVGSVTTEASSAVASGRVISQSPQADTYLGSGAAVNLVVSSGRNGNGGGGGGAMGLEMLALVGLLSAFTTRRGSNRYRPARASPSSVARRWMCSSPR
jgi:hypothetical protein